jgi:hypothetical protein
MGRALLYLFAPNRDALRTKLISLSEHWNRTYTVFWSQTKVNLSPEYLTLGRCIGYDIVTI